MNETYQVRRYETSGASGGYQIATGVTLEAAVEIALRLTRLQQEIGGLDDFTILPD